MVRGLSAAKQAIDAIAESASKVVGHPTVARPLARLLGITVNAVEWYWEAKYRDVISQMSGGKRDPQVALVEAGVSSASTPIVATAALLGFASLTSAVSRHVAGPQTYLGRLAGVAEIKERMAAENSERRLIVLLDNVRGSLGGDEAAIKALGPHLLHALPSLYGLQSTDDDVAQEALVALQNAGALNKVLGLEDREAIVAFWSARRADVLRDPIPPAA